MSDYDLTTSPVGYENQASPLANTFLCQAVEHIDGLLGKGYAASHPELLAAFIQATATTYQTAVLKVAAQEVRNALCDIAEAVQRLADVSA